MVKKRDAVTIIFVLVFLGILLIKAVQLYPLIMAVITNTGDESNALAFIDTHGANGVPILLSLAVLQVIFPVIPAPAVGILTGLCYGVVWGPLIMLAGCVLGNLFVFISVRQLSGLITPHERPNPKHSGLLSREELDRLRRPEIVALFCFLIPGLGSMTPYLFARTKISLPKYLLAAAVGNVPFILMYVFLGERVSSGNYTTAIVLAVIVILVILILLPFRKKIMGKILREA